VIIDEIGNHVSPVQAFAAVWLFAGFFAGKALRVGTELMWCSITGRDIRPCKCRHCRSVRMAAGLAHTRQGLAEVIPFPVGEGVSAA
jgi:hypothetical protein